MMKKCLSGFILTCLIILALLLVSCGGQTATTTSPTTTIPPTSTSPSSTPPSPSATETQTPGPTQTPSPSETTEPSPTTTKNPFHGTLSGTWIEETPLAQKLHGTFSITIDEDGNITGIFRGDYVGTVTGTVDLGGNMEAIGVATLGGIEFDLLWLGQFYLDGTALSAEGTWSGPLSHGTFTGTGTTA